MKVLFFGLGGVGQRHLRNLLKIEPETVIGAVKKTSRSFEIDDKLCAHKDVDIIKKYNIEKFSSLKDAEGFNPDFAIVTNPTSEHVKTSIDLVEKGIPVFMEKPISDKYMGLKDLLDVSKKKNVPVMIGYMMRFNPCAIKIKEMVEENRIGRIYSVVLIINSYLPSWHKYEKVNEFYAGCKKLGGGVVLTLCHPFDYLRWLFGDVDQVTAYTRTTGILDLNVEDVADVLLRFDSGIIANVHLDHLQKPSHHVLEIIGSEGTIRWDNADGAVRWWSISCQDWMSLSTPEGFERNDLFLEEMRHFIEVANGNEAPVCTFEDGIHALKIALAVHESAEEGRTITIAYNRGEEHGGIR